MDFFVRLQAVKRAHERALRFCKQSEQSEQRFALIRFIIIISILATLAGLYSVLNFYVWGFVVVLGIVGIIACVRIHRRFVENLERWRGLVQSYAATCARMERESSVFAADSLQPPWITPLRKSIPADHPYAWDLDVSSGVLALLDTCSTPLGSKLLQERVLAAGCMSFSPDLIVVWRKRAQVLTTRTQILRNIESLRYRQDILKMYLETSAKNAQASRVQNQQEEQSKESSSFAFFSQSKPWVEYGVLGLGMLAWLTAVLLTVIFLASHKPTWVSYVWPVYVLIPLISLPYYDSLLQQAYFLLRDTHSVAKVFPYFAKIAELPEFENLPGVKTHVLKEISAVQRILDFISIRTHPLLWLFVNIVLPYDALLLLWLKLKLAKLKLYLPEWQALVGEIDFSAAIARFAWENPSFSFVDLEQSLRATDFYAKDLGHPLLFEGRRVCNTLHLTPTRRVVLLTGSNMSGKSTFLRTLGVNVLLVQMGAPVCARELQAPMLHVFCAMRVSDSLLSGVSYFYAEVQRLAFIAKKLKELESTGERSLFLIDEIFRGTNNRERFIGSWCYIRSLLKFSSFGVVSTHDLALTKLENHAPEIVNMHFSDAFENNMLTFHYTLQSGPCTTTNALHIMRREGLEVSETEGDLC